ncbi:MAG: YihA family ribosome biogenesis GTP-binding protein [Myxococcales bacterium]|nr:YihA family ribosome biogenesis GTP-binding protein [Myxococcales bacterium]
MVDNPYVHSVSFIKSAVLPKDYPDSDLPEIAVAGRSNVGKSSLINRLVNRRRLAKVSNTPGRTQLLNFFLVNDRFVLCDLPGYGFARVPKKIKDGWGRMVESYLAERNQIKALLILTDVRRQPGDWEKQMFTWASHFGYAVIPVATKIDKLPVSKRKPGIASTAKGLGLNAKQVVAWSAVSGVGLEELWARIDRVV